MIGKRVVTHIYDDKKWYDGLVIDMSIENNEYMYTIHYDNEPDDLYILDLLNNLKKKELKLLEVTPEFFI